MENKKRKRKPSIGRKQKKRRSQVSDQSQKEKLSDDFFPEGKDINLETKYTKYNRGVKGKLRAKAYICTEKGKSAKEKATKKYVATEKGKVSARKYTSSEKGKNIFRKYITTDKGISKQKEAVKNISIQRRAFLEKKKQIKDILPRRRVLLEKKKQKKDTIKKMKEENHRMLIKFVKDYIC